MEPTRRESPNRSDCIARNVNRGSAPSITDIVGTIWPVATEGLVANVRNCLVC